MMFDFQEYWCIIAYFYVWYNQMNTLWIVHDCDNILCFKRNYKKTKLFLTQNFVPLEHVQLRVSSLSVCGND